MRRHYYLTGIDGIGKTTQVDLLEKHLAGQHPQRVWLRFPVFFSLPLLIYARLFGFTRYETLDGVRVGAWEFQRSLLLQNLFPYTQYLDTVVLSIGRVWIPLLLGRTLLIERYALDVLADIMVATGRDRLHESRLGQLFIRLVPSRTQILIMCAPVDQVRSRRADLARDPLIARRAEVYAVLARHLRCTLIRADLPVASVEASIRDATVHT